MASELHFCKASSLNPGHSVDWDSRPCGGQSLVPPLSVPPLRVPFSVGTSVTFKPLLLICHGPQPGRDGEAARGTFCHPEENLDIFKSPPSLRVITAPTLKAERIIGRTVTIVKSSPFHSHHAEHFGAPCHLVLTKSPREVTCMVPMKKQRVRELKPSNMA